MTARPEPADGDRWLFHNRHGGISIGVGLTARAAKADVLDAIAEAFTSEGLSSSAAKRAAYSYHVRLIAGPGAGQCGLGSSTIRSPDLYSVTT